jgi:GNAT superfamily N-acetyltransferase
MMSMAKLER